MANCRNNNTAPCGFSLIELILAIFVIAFGMMGLFALFSGGLMWSNETEEQSQTALLISSIATDIQNTLRADFSPILPELSNGDLYHYIADEINDITADGTIYSYYKLEGTNQTRAFALSIELLNAPDGAAEAFVKIYPKGFTNAPPTVAFFKYYDFHTP